MMGFILLDIQMQESCQCDGGLTSGRAPDLRFTVILFTKYYLHIRAYVDAFTLRIQCAADEEIHIVEATYGENICPSNGCDCDVDRLIEVGSM